MFFMKRFHTHKKYKKHKTQIKNFHSDNFICTKSTKCKQQLSLRCFLFTQKAQKAQKTQMSNKQLSLRRFIRARKAQKASIAQKVKQATFFLFDVFIAHKNAVFFVLHIKKQKKHIKSIKTQISKQVTFFPLDVF